MGDADYLHAFQSIVMPIAMEFAPEIVISKKILSICTQRLTFVVQFLLDLMLLKEMI